MLTYSPSDGLGSPLPHFRLPSVEGRWLESEKVSSQVLVVMFICAHCPYVQAIEDRMINLGRNFDNNHVQFLGICANDSKDYPEDRPDALLKRWHDKQYSFPYLIDEDQSVATNLKAVCTPDIFVYDQNRQLVYRGRFDDSWRNPDKVRSEDLKNAIENTLQGRSPVSPQFPSMGCSIKWKNQ